MTLLLQSAFINPSQALPSSREEGWDCAWAAAQFASLRTQIAHGDFCFHSNNRDIKSRSPLVKQRGSRKPVGARSPLSIPWAQSASIAREKGTWDARQPDRSVSQTFVLNKSPRLTNLRAQAVSPQVIFSATDFFVTDSGP